MAKKDEVIAISDTAIVGALNVLGHKHIGMQRNPKDPKRVEFIYTRSTKIEKHYQSVINGEERVVAMDFAMELHNVRNKIKHFNNINPL